MSKGLAKPMKIKGISSSPAIKKKIKLLCWMDSPYSTTGFGIVARWVLEALHATGRYDITILAINHYKIFVENCPYTIIPASLQRNSDPYGSKILQSLLEQYKWDMLFVINDNFVCELVVPMITALKDRPKIVYYYPVDCRVYPGRSKFIPLADRAVPYTQWALQETLKVYPQLEGQLSYIYHGVDTETYKHLPDEITKGVKKKIFGDDDKFVISSVNRNNVRKNLPQLLFAFKMFKDKYPNSIMNLHTDPTDGDINLFAAMEHLGLKREQDVYFPSNYHTAQGMPEHALNRLYNLSDLFITPTLGEGFGLGAIEALAAECPVLVPENTVHPELFDGRGWFYPCREWRYVDSSGYRKAARDEDFFNALIDFKKKHDENNPEIRLRRRLGREWCEKHDWRKIGRQWVELFYQVDHQDKKIPEAADTTVALQEV